MSLADHSHCLGNRGQWKGLEVLPFSSLGLWTPPLPLGRSGVSRWSLPESILFFFFQLLPRLWFLFLFSFLAGSLLSSSFLHGLSLVTVNRGASLVAVQGLLTAVASFVAEHGLSCLMATKVTRGPEVWDLSSRTRDRTHVPCVGSCTSNHRATREVPPESIPSTQRVWVAALVISWKQTLMGSVQAV